MQVAGVVWLHYTCCTKASIISIMATTSPLVLEPNSYSVPSKGSNVHNVFWNGVTL